jgi:hypothetical protein
MGKEVINYKLTLSIIWAYLWLQRGLIGVPLSGLSPCRTASRLRLGGVREASGHGRGDAVFMGGRKKEKGADEKTHFHSCSQN